MISQLSLLEIEKIISENIEFGNPNSKAIIPIQLLEKNKKKLFGTYDNGKFAITFNAASDSTPYILLGS